MRLHLGCGKRYISGWTNIDGAEIAGQKKPDMVLDLSKPLPFDDRSINEIMAIHLFEHFYPQDALGILSDWYRVLRPMGRLVLEMPDIYKSAKNLIADIESGKQPSDKWAIWPIYGDNPNKSHYDDHKAGWTFKTLEPVLKKAGFGMIKECPPEFHGRKTNRDFRIEAIKC